MDYSLFTVTVTALVGSLSDMDAGEVLRALAGALAISGIQDAAVTYGAGALSFTGQVEAPNALAAVRQAGTAMVLAGYINVSAVHVEAFTEEEAHASTDLRIAVA